LTQKGEGKGLYCRGSCAVSRAMIALTEGLSQPQAVA
jgi:hypothetical protein